MPTHALPTVPNIEVMGITLDTMEPDAKKLALVRKGACASMQVHFCAYLMDLCNHAKNMIENLSVGPQAQGGRFNTIAECEALANTAH